MAVNFSPIFNSQVVDSSGNPASGWKIYSYAAGSSTAQDTYTTSAGSVAQSNPIIINSLGFPTTGQIWLTSGQSYKLVLTNASDVVQKTEDNISGVNDTSVTIDQWVASGLTPTYVSATSFTLTGDQTTAFHVGRRLKTTNSGGTIYSTITTTAYGALTTVTVANDSGTLDSGLSAVSYGIITATNTSVNDDMDNRKGTAVASAATTNIWGIAGDFVHITGSTGPITSLGTAPYAGAQRTLIFDSTPSITHNATTLVLPGGRDITAAANDRAVVRADTTANMVVVDYIKATGMPVASFPLMHISGLLWQNNSGDATNDIDIAAGSCRDSTNTVDIVCAAMTKQLDANWAVGTNAGMRNSAAAITDTDYYIYAVSTAPGVQDYYAHTSATIATVITALQAESGGSAYVYARMIGWIKRVAGTIVAFKTYETEGGGIDLLWSAPTLDINVANTLTTSRRTDAVKVPLNFSTEANLNVLIDDATTQSSTWICCPDQTDAAPSTSAAPLSNIPQASGAIRFGSTALRVRTSATGTIAARSTLATVDLYAVSTMGFRWARRN